MPFNNAWDESDPADTKAAALGAQDIRELMYAVRERLAIDHYHLAIEGSDVKIGYHKSGTFIDQTNDLLGVTGAVRLYGKTVAGIVEVFLVLANNTVVQITRNGKLDAASIDGVIPIANLATGTPNGLKFVRDDGTLQVPFTLKSGAVIQSKYVDTGALVTGAGTIAGYLTDNIPLSTDGNLILTADPITAEDALNSFEAEGVIQAGQGTNTGNIITIAVFDGTVCKETSRFPMMANWNYGPQAIPFKVRFVAGDLVAHTFTVRAGLDTGPISINGAAGFRANGGVCLSSLTVKEIKA